MIDKRYYLIRRKSDGLFLSGLYYTFTFEKENYRWFSNKATVKSFFTRIKNNALKPHHPYKDDMYKPFVENDVEIVEYSLKEEGTI